MCGRVRNSDVNPSQPRLCWGPEVLRPKRVPPGEGWTPGGRRETPPNQTHVTGWGRRTGTQAVDGSKQGRRPCALVLHRPGQRGAPSFPRDTGSSANDRFHPRTNRSRTSRSSRFLRPRGPWSWSSCLLLGPTARCREAAWPGRRRGRPTGRARPSKAALPVVHRRDAASACADLRLDLHVFRLASGRVSEI
jgi:hypothetical protein